MNEKTKTAKLYESVHRNATELLPYGMPFQKYINTLLTRQLRIERRKKEAREARARK